MQGGQLETTGESVMPRLGRGPKQANHAAANSRTTQPQPRHSIKPTNAAEQSMEKKALRSGVLRPRGTARRCVPTRDPTKPPRPTPSASSLVHSSARQRKGRRAAGLPLPGAPRASQRVPGREQKAHAARASSRPLPAEAAEPRA